ncbi:uncharacterized protein LAJ45_09832 [Morchella importuna]|uniref:Uncharacterized protein n=1 Tax=Morchella conica CCBAS932 TaxID=1392247 RepID=A0A3N4KLF2_9PEZI|nr:uncharacterized protein LAJ45_09832 [Morchella importuna]KAH8146142.1 hypothetical protein LAJ45_09832 [Morchella importuna]RPB11350.1 hypothetical protein P167DRAFT_546416 [Morchella conica CCBAS932]
MPSLPVVITQSLTTSYAASSIAPNSATSSTFPSSSTSDRCSSLSSTVSSSSAGSYHAHTSATRPPQVTAQTPYGKKEFIHTGRPQGGNPHGGPRQNMEGYERVSRGNVTVHNTGGQARGLNSVKLGVESGNDERHTKECRELSRYSDNVGLCFCPPSEN